MFNITIYAVTNGWIVEWHSRSAGIQKAVFEDYEMLKQEVTSLLQQWGGVNG